MRVKAPIQIRFADTDMLGHVNNANYLTYMELARMAYIEQVCNIIDWSKEGFILAKATVDYRKPIFIDDQLSIEIWVDHISSKSFSMSYQFFVEKNGEKILKSEGSTVLVCFDYINHVSIVMPQAWKDLIQAHEQKSIMA